MASPPVADPKPSGDDAATKKSPQNAEKGRSFRSPSRSDRSRSISRSRSPSPSRHRGGPKKQPSPGAENQQPIDDTKELPISDKPAASAEKTRLHVGGLTRNVTEEHLKEIFTTFGEVRSVELAMDRKVNLPRGFAYIEYIDRPGADKARDYMDGGQIDGNVVKVQFLDQRPPTKSKSPGATRGRKSRSKSRSRSYDRRGPQRGGGPSGRSPPRGRGGVSPPRGRPGPAPGPGPWGRRGSPPPRGGFGYGPRDGMMMRDGRGPPPPPPRAYGGGGYIDQRGAGRSPPRGRRGRSLSRSRSPPRRSRGSSRSPGYRRRSPPRGRTPPRGRSPPRRRGASPQRRRGRSRTRSRSRSYSSRSTSRSTRSTRSYSSDSSSRSRSRSRSAKRSRGKS